MQVAPLVPILHWVLLYWGCCEVQVNLNSTQMRYSLQGTAHTRPALWLLEVWNPSHGFLLWSHWQFFIVDVKRLKCSRNPSLPGFIQHYLKEITWFVPPVCVCAEWFVPLRCDQILLALSGIWKLEKCLSGLSLLTSAEPVMPRQRSEIW